MIYSLSGKVFAITDDAVILDVNGVGFEVFVNKICWLNIRLVIIYSCSFIWSSDRIFGALWL